MPHQDTNTLQGVTSGGGSRLVDVGRGDLENLVSSLTAAHLEAAVPTTGLAAAAADEISEAVAALFAGYGQEYQALLTQAGAFQQRFLHALSSAAGPPTGANPALL
jgi:hypothetical protein